MIFAFVAFLLRVRRPSTSDINIAAYVWGGGYMRDCGQPTKMNHRNNGFSGIEDQKNQNIGFIFFGRGILLGHGRMLRITWLLNNWAGNQLPFPLISFPRGTQEDETSWESVALPLDKLHIGQVPCSGVTA
ncbi:hypothetical protein VR010_14575 [Actinomycetaceae bacterium L2_0104]